MPLCRLSDGRDLEYEISGPSTGPAVVFHDGRPGSAVPMPTVLDPVTERGFRVITAGTRPSVHRDRRPG